jgi:hypothetical protein
MDGRTYELALLRTLGF